MIDKLNRLWVAFRVFGIPVVFITFFRWENWLEILVNFVSSAIIIGLGISWVLAVKEL